MRRSGSLLAAIAGWVIGIMLFLISIGLAGVIAGMLGVLFYADLDTHLRAAIGSDAPTQAQLAALLAGVAGFLGLLIALMVKLLRILQTVKRGDPFNAENPRNLYWVAGLLAATEIFSNIIALLAPHTDTVRTGGAGFDLTSWLAVLIVLVLAEVFREGSRLRAEAELTV